QTWVRMAQPHPPPELQSSRFSITKQGAPQASTQPTTPCGNSRLSRLRPRVFQVRLCLRLQFNDRRIRFVMLRPLTGGDMAFSVLSGRFGRPPPHQVHTNVNSRFEVWCRLHLREIGARLRVSDRYLWLRLRDVL